MNAPPAGPASMVGPHIKYLNHAFSRKFSEVARSRGIDAFSVIHFHSVGFLYCNQEKPFYQRDLEETFNITRSSVTGVVQLLERNRLITRRSVADDARLKQLCLTPQGIKLCLQTIQALDQVETLAVRGLSPEQVETFLSLCRIIEGNLSNNKE